MIFKRKVYDKLKEWKTLSAGSSALSSGRSKTYWKKYDCGRICKKRI